MVTSSPEGPHDHRTGTVPPVPMRTCGCTAVAVAPHAAGRRRSPARAHPDRGTCVQTRSPRPAAALGSVVPDGPVVAVCTQKPIVQLYVAQIIL